MIMLNITTKSIYGINALIYLAEIYGDGLAQVKNIAKNKKIPQNFLVQILNKLVKAGFVKSIRGVNGGYKLQLPPERISILSVLEVLEGKINFCDNLENTNAIFSLFMDAESELRKVFDVSLKDVLNKQKKIKNQIIYYI